MSEPLLKNLQPLRRMGNSLVTSVGILVIALEPDTGRLQGVGICYEEGESKITFERAGQSTTGNRCACGAEIGPRSRACRDHAFEKPKGGVVEKKG